MYTRILVPLDGSARAERAVPVAARIARASGGSVTLVQVVRVPASYGPYLYGGDVLNPRILDEEQAAVEEYLKRIAASPELQGVQTQIKATVGISAPAILDLATFYKADLIVMTSHGRTGFKRWLMGSIAQQVARHAPVPVIIVRQDSSAQLTSAEPDHLTRLLVPLDGSPHAEMALLPAVDLVTALAGKGAGALHLLRVVDPREIAILGIAEPVAVQDAKAYLRQVADHVQAERPDALSYPITYSVAVDDDAASAIIRVAQDGEDAEGAGAFGGCDGIALATHGRSGFTRWAIGSVAERVLQGTRRPLLLVRPQPAAGDKQASTATDTTATKGDTASDSSSDSTWSALF
ncbi:MAG TPA: universal stress protein [Ktedonobacterales bacterium]|nr:universal stress protein [Ktedonobacterales bacterium]